tara:strand:- start:442 stop:639 length:198 start_codon:yes stop_codon:yes gene_type:complete
MIDSDAKADAQVGVTSANGKYRASLWATNFTDACNFNYSALAAEAFVRYASLQQTFSVAFGVKFD